MLNPFKPSLRGDKMLKVAQELEEIWLPEWMEKQLTALANHKNIHPTDLLLVAALLGYPTLKDMTAEQILNLLEEAALK